MSEEEIIEETGDSELRQMQKLQEYRKLAQSVLQRRVIELSVVFVTTCVIAASFVWYKVKTSPNRFESMTNLVFYPKSTQGIKPLDDNQVMRILTRRTMSVKAASELGMSPDEADGLFGAFEVVQDRQNSNFFAVNAKGPTEAEAVRRVNAFADAALREYAAYRLEDLRTRRETTDRRRAEIARESAKIDEEEKTLSEELGVAQPQNESQRLTQEIADKKKSISQRTIDIADAETRLKEYRGQLGGANPAILDEADQVRKFADKLAQYDEDIEKLSLVYTDENPKLALAKEERRMVAERYRALLARYGMKNVSEGDLSRIDTVGKKAKEAKADLERHAASKQALESEMKQDQEKLTEILKVLPRFEGFKTRRAALEAGRSAVNQSDADIRFLEATVTSELSQLERAVKGMGASVFSKKKLIAITAVGGIATALVAMIFLFLELLRGRIFDTEELSFYVDAVSLGEQGASVEGDDDAFITFRKELGEGKKLYFAPLGGTEGDSAFTDWFLLQCSMAGMKTLLVDVVRARDYTPDEADAMFTAVCYRGDRGKLPVVDPAALSAMEITMLEADLAMLLSDFDLVIMKGPDGSPRTVLGDQLSTICGTRLAVVRPGKTLRTEFKQFIEKEGVKTMSIAIKSLLVAVMLTFTGCYFDRLTSNYDQFPDLVDETSAIVDESGMSEGERLEQYRILKALDDAPPEVYRINAGDEVQFTVYDHADLATHATVTPDGHLGIVFLGQVKVANLTLKEACEKIEKGLAKYIKKPAVGITPLRISSQSCTIAGGCANPGIYPVSSEMRLADLYSMAGGTGVRRIEGDDLNIADLKHSYIFREGKALPVDFELAINGGDKLHNVRLKKNDYIFIGERSEQMVCVVGDVRSPRKQFFDRSMGLIELLTYAGWLNETHWSHVIIIRGGVANPKLYKVNVDAILAGKRPNVQMQTGDIVYVPHDNISEYNVFVRKLLPTGQLFNMIASPFTTWNNLSNGSNASRAN